MFEITKFISDVRKFIAALLAVFTALGQTTGIQVVSRGVHSNMLSVYSYSFYEPTVKLTQSFTLDKNGKITMYAAKNESEYCQFVFRSRDDRKNTYFEVSDFSPV